MNNSPIKTTASSPVELTQFPECLHGFHSWWCSFVSPLMASRMPDTGNSCTLQPLSSELSIVTLASVKKYPNPPISFQVLVVHLVICTYIGLSRGFFLLMGVVLFV